MRRFLACLLAALLFTAPALAENAESDLGQSVLTLVQAENEEALLKLCDENTANALRGKVAGLWPRLTLQMGAFKGTGGESVETENAARVHRLGLLFANASLVQSVYVDGEGRVIGLRYTPGTVESADTDIEETPVTLNPDGAYPLPGVLTFPKGTAPAAGIVLIHGSGPQDRDSAIGANAPFRDLARGLAARGFSVLRYDKRTFVHGEKMLLSPDAARMTVDEETADDARDALHFLAARKELESKPVYLLGHSMGGMLAAYIGKDMPECAGYILLAGTPRKLHELSREQTLRMAELLPENQKQAAVSAAEELRAAAERLPKMTDEEALDPQNAIFGLGAWYLRHMEQIDAARLHMEDKKPVLVLQGESDRQVTMEDFRLWREKLENHPDASFKSYPGLNHLFGRVDEPLVPFDKIVTEEYAKRTPVSDEVMDDIARWLKAHMQ